MSEVRVGPRFRRDLGDLNALARSIDALGLLHPVVVDRDRNLVAGLRRLTACKSLGWTKIPVRVVDLDGMRLVAERDENTTRKDFLPSEAVAVGRAVEEWERGRAKVRRLSGLRRGAKTPRPGKLPERGDTRDRVGAVVGLSGKTYEKARAVVEAAEKDPGLAHLVDAMDATGKVQESYLRLKGKGGAKGIPTEEEWFTPPVYIEAAREVLGGIDLDPASCRAANRIVRATRFFDRKADGLRHDWPGRVWLNPPYGGLAGTFALRALDQYRKGITKAAILMLSTRFVERGWFVPFWDHPMCVHRTRIEFVLPSGETSENAHGTLFVYLGPRPRSFAKVFGRFGAVITRWPAPIASKRRGNARPASHRRGAGTSGRTPR
ncbi:MAG: ParB N-terminal domain-containing protein [Planctomycetes bacterium]|nr:ParB N-terminal domain-containing protein [Planctomycetota bacterium]